MKITYYCHSLASTCCLPPLLLAVELFVGFCLPAEVVIDHGLQDIVVIGAVW